jgi:hypothetical protein
MKKIISAILILFLSGYIYDFGVRAQSNAQNSTTNPNPQTGQSGVTEAKPTENDKKALEGVIVEKYYAADAEDYQNHDDSIYVRSHRKKHHGGRMHINHAELDKGSVTYRIYIDLKPDYWLQVVYGAPHHPLTVKTTTRFYNNTVCGGSIGYNMNIHNLNDDNCLLDSYFTMNSACNMYAGVLLTEDKDGSVLTRKAFSKADGLTNGNLPQIKPFNMDFGFWNNDSNATVFTTENGGWAGLSGIKAGAKGPTPENRILIAQLTTNGKPSFELNIQIGTPAGGTVRFVAKDPVGDEVKADALTYNMKK